MCGYDLKTIKVSFWCFLMCWVHWKDHWKINCNLLVYELILTLECLTTYRSYDQWQVIWRFLSGFRDRGFWSVGLHLLLAGLTTLELDRKVGQGVLGAKRHSMEIMSMRYVLAEVKFRESLRRERMNSVLIIQYQMKSRDHQILAGDQQRSQKFCWCWKLGP